MKAWLYRLTLREKVVVGVALVLSLLFALRVVVAPVIGGSSKGKKRLERRLADLSQMEKLAQEYRQIKGLQAGGISPLKQGESLFAFLDGMAGKSGIRDKVSTMKPSIVKSRDGSVNLSVVEMKIVDLDMKELTAFLHGVESSGDLIGVRDISLTRTEKTELLTATLYIETVAP